MSRPIVTTESVATQHEERKVEHTYEELLDIFDNDGSNLVRPLVLRCQAYENQIAKLNSGIARKGATMICEKCKEAEQCAGCKQDLLFGVSHWCAACVSKYIDGATQAIAERDKAKVEHAKLLEAVAELRHGFDVAHNVCSLLVYVRNGLDAILAEHAKEKP